MNEERTGKCLRQAVPGLQIGWTGWSLGMALRATFISMLWYVPLVVSAGFRWREAQDYFDRTLAPNHTTGKCLRQAVPDLQIGWTGWSLGPQNLGGLRPICIVLLTLLLNFHTYAVLAHSMDLQILFFYRHIYIDSPSVARGLQYLFEIVL
jgi:hypothetical protein